MWYRAISPPPMRYRNRISQSSPHASIFSPMRYRSSHRRSSLHRLSHRRITTSSLIAYHLSFTDAISRFPVCRLINPRIQRFILISQAHIAITYRYRLSHKVKPSSFIIAKSPPMRYRYRISQYHLSLFLTPGPSQTRYCDFCSAVQSALVWSNGPNPFLPTVIAPALQIKNLSPKVTFAS